MDSHATTPDPAAIIQALDSRAIRAQLDRIYADERALRVLLRAAIARERYEPDRREAAPCRQ